MADSVFVLRRDFVGEDGHTYREIATIFASSLNQARVLLRDELQTLAEDADSDPALFGRPEWDVLLEGDLDRPKVLTLYYNRK